MQELDESRVARLRTAVGVITTLMLTAKVVPQEELPQIILDSSDFLHIIDLILTGDTYARNLEDDLTLLYKALTQHTEVPLSAEGSFLLINLKRTKTIDFKGSVTDVWQKLKRQK